MIWNQSLSGIADRLSLLVIVLLTLSGCGAASMRIDVEVYKGPLSKTVNTQTGELFGLIEDASQSLETYKRALILTGIRKGFVSFDKFNKSDKPDKASEEDDQLVGEILNTETLSKEIDWCKDDYVLKKKKCFMGKRISACAYMAHLYNDVKILLDDFQSLNDKIKNLEKGKIVEFLNEAIKLSQSLKQCMTDKDTNKDNAQFELIDLVSQLDKIHNSLADFHHKDWQVLESKLSKANQTLADITRRQKLKNDKAVEAAKAKTTLSRSTAEKTGTLNALGDRIKDIVSAASMTISSIPSIQAELKSAIKIARAIKSSCGTKKLDEIVGKLQSAINEANRRSEVFDRMDKNIKKLNTKLASLAGRMKNSLKSAAIKESLQAIGEELQDIAKKLGDLAEAFGVVPKSVNINREILQDASNLSMKLKGKAMYYAEAQLAVPIRITEVRIAVTNFCNLASEYSNQIASRVDVLEFQINEGIDRKNLPLSKFLQNIKPTDFINLFTWNRAVTLPIKAELLLHPIHALSSDETADRVRVIERLFADHHWQNVNTVYASGQGDIAMALIKDDIGNWNLKSFDSDPTELLNAYKELTKAGIKAATKLIATQATGASTLASALKLSDRLTSGRVGSRTGAPMLDVHSLRQRTIQRLEALKSDVGKEETAIEKEIASIKEELFRKEQVVHDKTEEMNNEPPVLETQNNNKLLAYNAKTSAKEARTKAIEAELSAKNSGDTASAKAAIEHAKIAKDLAREAEHHADNVLIQFDSEAKEAKQEAESASKKAAQALARAQTAEATADLAQSKAEMAEAVKEQQDFQKQTITQARRILNNYGVLIDALQEGIISSREPKPATLISNDIEGDRGT